MVDIKTKEEVSGKYKELLKLIYIVGNGIMLQSDFIEIGKLFNLINTDYKANKIIKELEESKLIKKEQFLDTKYKLIILMKYSIRFLEGKEKSCEVASIPKHTTQRSIHSIIRANYFKRFSQKLINEKDFNLDYCIDKLKTNGATCLYSNMQGIKYLDNFSKLDIYNPNNKIHKLNFEQNQTAIKNRKIGQDSKNNKGTKGGLYSNVNIKEELENKINTVEFKDIRARIEKEIDKTTMDTIISSNIYVTKIEKNADKLIIKASIWDIDDTQNIDRTIEKILKICYVYTNITNKKCFYRITIMARSSVAEKNYKKKLFDLNKDKETYLNSKIRQYHRANGVKSTFLNELKIDEKEDIHVTVKKSLLSKYYED